MYELFNEYYVVVINNVSKLDYSEKEESTILQSVKEIAVAIINWYREGKASQNSNFYVVK